MSGEDTTLSKEKLSNLKLLNDSYDAFLDLVELSFEIKLAKTIR